MQTTIRPFTKLNFLFIILSINYISCNIWDNLISQLSSPQFSIPDELKLELFNEDRKAMEVLVSSKFNTIKFSLINEDLVNSVIPGNLTSTVADVYLNFTNGTIQMDFDDSCYYKNASQIRAMTTKFILNSYDLLTFFYETSDYYEYIYTNPLQKALDNTANRSKFSLRSLKKNEELRNLIELPETINNHADTINNFLLKNNVLDKDSMIMFKVNKKTTILETINLKYKQVNLTSLDVKVHRVDSFAEDDFKIKHECQLLEEKDIDEIDIVPIDRKSAPGNFLSLIES
jgi:hypothetical protein